MNRWIFLDTRTPRGACTWNLGLDVIPIRPIQVKGSAGFMEGSRSSLLFIGMGGLGARAIEVARRLYPEAAFRMTGLQSPAGQGTADAADMLMEADRIVILGEFGNRREGVLLADLMSEAVVSERPLMAIIGMPCRCEEPAMLMRAVLQKRMGLELAQYCEVIHLVTFQEDDLVRHHRSAQSSADLSRRISEEMLGIFGDLVRHGYFPLTG